MVSRSRRIQPKHIPMTSLSVRVRPALKSDNKRIRDFYLATETETLPPPPLSTITKALAAGTLLVVENCANDSVLATGGYFEYIKLGKRHLIFEFAGTRVTKAIGRLRPVPLQQILLALRFFQIASTEGEQNNKVSVISSARHAKSQENLMALHMTEIVAMPDWLDYDVCSWTRMTERAQWRHYVATNGSLTKAIEILQQVEFSNGGFKCSSSRMSSSGAAEELDLSIEYVLPIRQVFPALLQAHQQNETKSALSPLPARAF